MRVFLDDILIQDQVDGLDNISIDYSRENETGNQVIDLTSSLTFYGDGYDIIKAKLIDPVDGKNNKVKIVIDDDSCCGEIFEGKISGDAIDWCIGDCSVTANAMQDDGITEILKYLDSTILMSKDSGVDDIQHPNIVTNKGKYASPLVRELIELHCDRINCNFKSTILNNPNSEYTDLVYFDHQVKGAEEKELGLVDENKPLITVKEFLDKLAPVFNARWRVYKNGQKNITNPFVNRAGYTLSFEKKTDQLGKTWASRDDVEVVDDVCFEWLDERLPAFGRFQYSKDFIDKVGIDVADRYDDIVEWNEPPSPEQQGGLSVLLQFAHAEFDIEFKRVRKVEAGKKTTFENKAAFGKLNLETDTISIPKLIIWDRSSGRDKALAKLYDVNIPYDDSRRDLLSIRGDLRAKKEVKYVVNYPMFFDEQRNNGGTKSIKFSNTTIGTLKFKPQPNLYQFYADENPRIRQDRNKSYEITFKFDCDLFKTFNITKGFELSEFGIGNIEKARFNFKNREVTINGKI